MKSIYAHRSTRAIADIDMLDDGTYLITRINVPLGHRGKGIARRLLREILHDADLEGITLKLECCPSGGLSFPQLFDWYYRHGFRVVGEYSFGALMERLPQKPHELTEEFINHRHDEEIV